MTDMPQTFLGHLDVWYSQKPTVALMGEFSAGKSTLLNLILGTSILPTQVTATNMPVIWMTHGQEATAAGLTEEGVLEPFPFDALKDQSGKGYRLFRLTLPAPILERIDVIDTPGISDSRLAIGALNFLNPYLDTVLWCSAANQAWRQSEKAVWSAMPDHLRSKSILALTRADTLRKANDLEKVMQRCETETADLFACVQPIATVLALKASNPDGGISDPAAWKKSHADALKSALEWAIDNAAEACAARPTLNTADTPEAPQPESPIETLQHPVSEGISVNIETEVLDPEPLQDLVSEIRQIGLSGSSKEQISDRLHHLFSAFLCDLQSSEEHRQVLSRAMSLEGFGEVDLGKAIKQLVREINDFTNKPQCRLDQIH